MLPTFTILARKVVTCITSMHPQMVKMPLLSTVEYVSDRFLSPMTKRAKYSPGLSFQPVSTAPIDCLPFYDNLKVNYILHGRRLSP